MKKEQFTFEIEEYESDEELTKEDAYLLAEAKKVIPFAYAPYSGFQVGAFALLENGQTVSGTNQENASYPAGICAERTLMSTAASVHPGVGIKSVAITYNNVNGKSDRPVSPCGICRQSLVEFQQRTKCPIRIILSGMTGKIQIISNSINLLPLAFGASDIQ